MNHRLLHIKIIAVFLMMQYFSGCTSKVPIRTWVPPQSAADNLFGQGEQYKFALHLDGKFGEGTAEELQFKSRQIYKVSRIEYEEQISYYKNLVENLKEEKGIE